MTRPGADKHRALCYSTAMDRPTIDQTLLATARVMAGRGTCSRLQVGAVVARDSRVVSSGWNGSPSGMAHCTHLDDNPCVISVHAEANAIAFAARAGVSTAGTTLYCTHAPCYDCAKLILNAGITRVVYAEKYRSEEGLTLLKAGGTVTEAGN